MKLQRDLRHLLKSVGAVLVREGHHCIYRLPSGRVFVMSKTCSDQRGLANARAVLKRLLAQDGVELPCR